MKEENKEDRENAQKPELMWFDLGDLHPQWKTFDVLHHYY